MSRSGSAPTSESGSDLDNSYVRLSALKPNLDASLALYADIILNPSFPETDFKRLQKQQIAGIQREKAQPVGMALRVFPKLLYGTGHPYGLPFSGIGVRRRRREDHARRPRQVPRRVVQAQQRHDGHRRRHDDGRDQAQAGSAVQGLEEGTTPDEEALDRRRQGQDDDLHPRQAGRRAVGDPGRPARGADRQPRRDPVQDDDAGAGRLVRRAAST